MKKPLQNLKFYIKTFGCQMNENDSEHLAGILAEEGAGKAEDPETSDIIIINTCAVRKKSEEKLYSYLGRLASIKKRRQAVIGVVGCVAQLQKSELLERKYPVDFVMGPHNYHRFPQILSRDLQEKSIATAWSRKWEEGFRRTSLREDHTSAYVTIMEGCNNFCSFCIVPFARGREISRPLSLIIREAMNLVRQGYKEIQLLGQNVNSYRDPETGQGLAALLREIHSLDGLGWIRFLTSHPKNLTPEIVSAMKENRKVCRQLHLPLQSGSDAVLSRMNRGYTRNEYLEKAGMLRDAMPEISLSTDIIVGFPGESEKDFEYTLGILKEVRFTNIFSFCYSPRPRTAAARLEDDVPPEEKKRRLMEIQQLQKKIQLESHRRLIEKTIKVLCLGKSKKSPSVYSGRNEGHEVVNFESSRRNVIGYFVDVRITGCGPYSLLGKESDSTPA